MDPVRSHRFGDSLQLLRTEILEIKCSMKELTGSFADEQGVWRRQPLDTRGNVRGLSQRESLVASTASNITHDHNTCVDADSKGDADAVSGLEVRIEFIEACKNPQTGPHGPVGIILMRASS